MHQHRFFLLILILIFGCKTNNKNSLKTIYEDTQKKVLEQQEGNLIPTDKNEANVILIENVYYNSKYKFMITFPVNWEYDTNGPTSTTIARAMNHKKKAVIALNVGDFSKKRTDFKNGLEEFKKGFEEQLLANKIIYKNYDVTKGTLNNNPSYIIELTLIEATDSGIKKFFSKQIQCFHNSILYIITIKLPVENWNSEISNTFDEVISSLIFQ